MVFTDIPYYIYMDIESIREHCLSLPLVTEDFPFDEEVLAFRVGGKIFAMLNLANTEWFVLKCDPDMALELRERYIEITPAWHMNKRHWNQINLYGTLPQGLIHDLVAHSYSLVAAKLPKAFRMENPQTTEVLPEEGFLYINQ